MHISSMEGFRCESCARVLLTKHAFENHQKTKYHLSRVQIRNVPPGNVHACKKCNKIFSFSSGLYKHNKICVSEQPLVPTMKTIITRMEKLEETNVKLLATIESMKTQIVPSSTTNNLTTNNHNLTNNLTTNNLTNNINNNNQITVQELKIYLNTECKDAKTILDFIDTINLTVNERCQLELINYNSIVSEIWKRNYLALPKNERPLYCVPTKESECTVFAKGDETWQEQKDGEFMTKLENKPKTFQDTMLATTAINETCSKICELYEASYPDDDIVTKLTPKTRGPDREEWNQRKAHLWHEACKLDAALREKEIAE